MRLAGKKALITGGGRGIGKEMALAFAREGADVAVCARTKSQLDLVAGEIRAIGRHGVAVAADVSREEDVKQMVEQTLAHFGTIHILVNCAGIGGPAGPVADTPVEEWDRTIAINLRGVFLVCRALIPVMLEHKSGKIINVSSTSGLRGFPRLAAYCSSKFAVIGLTQCLAKEVAAEGICVNTLCPGPVETSMARDHWPLIAADAGISVEELRANLINHIPQKRILPPQEVASAAVFLASSESDGITGTEIVVSGGFMGV